MGTTRLPRNKKQRNMEKPGIPDKKTRRRDTTGVKTLNLTVEYTFQLEAYI